MGGWVFDARSDQFEMKVLCLPLEYRIRIRLGAPTLTVDRTIFEMLLGAL